MPLKLIKGKILPIGVDLGSSAVKLAQLRTSDDSTELLAAGCAAIPREQSTNIHQRLEAFGQAIHMLTHGGNFKGKQCVLAIPSDCTFVQHIRIPKLPPEETAKAVQMELQGKLPFPSDEAVIRHIVVGDVFGDEEPKQEVVAIAASRESLEACLKSITKAGLEVTGINIDACAVVECFSRLFRRASDAARTILFVDVGAAATQVALSHGSKMVFARTLRMGGDQIEQAVASGLNISMDQARLLRRRSQTAIPDEAAQDELYRLMERPMSALADELTQCLRYYESVFRNQAVERAIFVGGQAYDKRLCQAVAQRLNLPAQVGDPLVRVKYADGVVLHAGIDRREPQPDWAVAVGLSLGAQAA